MATVLNRFSLSVCAKIALAVIMLLCRVCFKTITATTDNMILISYNTTKMKAFKIRLLGFLPGELKESVVMFIHGIPPRERYKVHVHH